MFQKHKQEENETIFQVNGWSTQKFRHYTERKERRCLSPECKMSSFEQLCLNISKFFVIHGCVIRLKMKC